MARGAMSMTGVSSRTGTRPRRCRGRSTGGRRSPGAPRGRRWSRARRRAIAAGRGACPVPRCTTSTSATAGSSTSSSDRAAAPSPAPRRTAAREDREQRPCEARGRLAGEDRPAPGALGRRRPRSGTGTSGRSPAGPGSSCPRRCCGPRTRSGPGSGSIVGGIRRVGEREPADVDQRHVARRPGHGEAVLLEADPVADRPRVRRGPRDRRDAACRRCPPVTSTRTDGSRIRERERDVGALLGGRSRPWRAGPRGRGGRRRARSVIVVRTERTPSTCVLELDHLAAGRRRAGGGATAGPPHAAAAEELEALRGLEPARGVVEQAGGGVPVVDRTAPNPNAESSLDQLAARARLHDRADARTLEVDGHRQCARSTSGSGPARGAARAPTASALAGAATRSRRTSPTAGTSRRGTAARGPASRCSSLTGGSSSAGSTRPVRASTTAIGTPAGTTASGTNAVTTSVRAQPDGLTTTRLARASRRGPDPRAEPPERVVEQVRRAVVRLERPRRLPRPLPAPGRASPRRPRPTGRRRRRCARRTGRATRGSRAAARRRSGDGGRTERPPRGSRRCPRPAAVAWAPRWIAVSCAAEPSPSDHQSFQSPVEGRDAIAERSPPPPRRSRCSSTAAGAARPSALAQSRTTSATTRLGAVLSASWPMTRRCSRSNGKAVAAQCVVAPGEAHQVAAVRERGSRRRPPRYAGSRSSTTSTDSAKPTSAPSA